MTLSNAVDNPILNSPFEAPSRYWDFSGPTPVVKEGRRRAGYYGTLRSDQVGAVASSELIDLAMVNEIRHRVTEWRARGYPNVTTVTRDLLEHWNRADRTRRFFFCQREAVETLIWLVEAHPNDRQGIDVPADAPNDPESLKKGYEALRRYCLKMATGSGKTLVMAMTAAWSILNKLTYRQDARFSDAVLVVGPNLTVKERLGVLVPQSPGNYYDAFELVPSGYRNLLARGKVFVTNWHAFLVQDDTGRRGVVQRGRESDAAFVKRVLGKALGGTSNLLVLNDEAHHAYRPAAPSEEERAQLELMDRDEKSELEAFAKEATVWVGGLDRINKVRGVRLVVDVSATPFYIKGTGYPEGTPLPWVVSDFGLVDAIESGITKVPRVPVADDSGRPDPQYFRLWDSIMARLPPAERGTNRRRPKPEAVWREAQGAAATLADRWQQTFDVFTASGQPVPPAMIVVCANTQLAQQVEEAIARGELRDELRGEATFRIDTSALAKAEAAVDGGTRQEAQEELRLKTATVGKASWPGGVEPEGWEGKEPPGKEVRCVVSVGMLTEGWDASNVTQILGLRAFRSQLLCEQVVGRGLRRMSYDVDPKTGLLLPEYCDVFGIPFEVIPVQGTGAAAPGPAAQPSTLVQALPERAALAIEFPRVEGYVADVRSRIRCDVDALPELVIHPQREPLQTVVRTQAGWLVGRPGLNQGVGEAQTLTRDAFYEQHRLQRTVFEIARDVTEVLAGGTVVAGTTPSTPKRIETARLLFPQVLAVAQSYVDRRVRTEGTAYKEELALAIYRDVVVQRLLDGIEPEVAAGEAPLLPRIERHRPTGSTAEVQFRTTKETFGTLKSHVSHVVVDSNYERAAAFHLEQSPHVVSYVKNDRLDFEIQYAAEDGTHRYRPDFLVRLRTPDGELTLVLETKGFETQRDQAKQSAAGRWVRAVNHHGGHGRWHFEVCRNPNDLPALLDRLVTRRAA